MHRTIMSSRDINAVRAFLRAQGFECGGRGWMNSAGKPAGIYWDSAAAEWYTVLDHTPDQARGGRG